MKGLRGREVQLHISVTWARVGNEWSFSRPGRFIPEKKPPTLIKRLGRLQSRSKRTDARKILFRCRSNHAITIQFLCGSAVVPPVNVT